MVLKNNDLVTSGLIAVYPNPVKNILNIKIASQGANKTTLIITDITGRSLIKKITNAGNGETIVQLDVSVLPAGIYYLKLIRTNGCENAPIKFEKN